MSEDRDAYSSALHALLTDDDRIDAKRGRRGETVTTIDQVAVAANTEALLAYGRTLAALAEEMLKVAAPEPALPRGHGWERVTKQTRIYMDRSDRDPAAHRLLGVITQLREEPDPRWIATNHCGLQYTHESTVAARNWVEHQATLR